VKPTFIIAGAIRCGTTSLSLWLTQHPDVFMPPEKELHYFERYHERKIHEWSDYLARFEPGRGKAAVGEASPSYLAKPESAAWIRFVLPDAKILLILRNPVDRAFSNYCFGLMRGWEFAPTFERALRRDRRWHSGSHSELEEERHGGMCYFRRGLYADQVQRFLEAFGPEAVRVWLFDDLAEKPKETYREICSYLGIRSDFTPGFQRLNQGRPPALIRLQRVLARASRHAVLPGSAPILRGVMEMNQALGRMVRRLDPSTRATLMEAYRPDVLRLGRLIGRDLSSWLGSPTAAPEAARPLTRAAP
jgi:hypothetical protein